MTQTKEDKYFVLICQIGFIILAFVFLIIYFGWIVNIPSNQFGDFGCNTTKLVDCFRG